MFYVFPFFPSFFFAFCSPKPLKKFFSPLFCACARFEIHTKNPACALLSAPSALLFYPLSPEDDFARDSIKISGV